MLIWAERLLQILCQSFKIFFVDFHFINLFKIILSTIVRFGLIEWNKNAAD